MARDIEGYARRNPAVFLGVAFGAGVLLSRFLKAGTSEQNARYEGRNFNTGSTGMGALPAGSTTGGTSGAGTSGLGTSGNVREFGGGTPDLNTPSSGGTGTGGF
jgi:hypothetical protein